MCGFVGVHDATGALPGDPLGDARRLVEHRGRDGFGTFKDASVSFAASQLRIVGGAEGRQPLRAADGRVLLFNGEIYNRPDAMAGIAPPRCDTAWLPEALPSGALLSTLAAIRGAFSLVLWDPRRRTLLLARDHAGQKPLYWHQTGARTWFASELSALMAVVADLQTDPELAAVEGVLGFLPAPHTSVRGVRKVPPGGWVEIAPAGVSEGRYWRTPPTDPRPGDEPALGELLRAAVAEQCAYPKVHIFQSGGLDSGVLLFLARQLGVPLQSWTVGVQQRTAGSTSDGVDPSDTALDLTEGERLARLLDVPHVGIGLDDAQTIAAARESAPYLDDRYFSISYPLTWALVRAAARAGARVALAGEGADELFCGYGYLDPSSAPGDLDVVIAGYVVARARFTESSRASRTVLDTAAALVRESVSDLDGLPPADLLRHIELRGSLAEALLPRVDRLSMRAQLEVRLPYLDFRLVEAALRMPPESNKAPLRRLARTLGVPASTCVSPKRRFGVRGNLLHTLADIRKSSPAAEAGNGGMPT
jgi:asparagine synthase (glutamine-hydrolysing)